MLLFSQETSRWICIHGITLAQGSTPEFHTELAEMMQDGLTVQLLRVESMAGPRHIYAAVTGALRAFEQKKNIAKNLGLEILVHASGHRQIKKALTLMGLRDGSRKAVLVIVGPNRQETEETIGHLKKIVPFSLKDDLIVKMTPQRKARLMKIFRIGRAEYRAAAVLGDEPGAVLEKLVVERVALLATEL